MGKIKVWLETNKSGNTTCQNLQATEKSVLRGKFTAKMPMLRNKKNLKQLNSIPSRNQKKKNKLSLKLTDKGNSKD